MNKKLEILFLCTGNSCRSQMAEGFASYYKKDIINAYSAGINPSTVNKNAIKVMDEVGVDISKHKSKSIKNFINKKFDFVITLCGDAKENCPFFPGASKVIHRGFLDPPSLAKELAQSGASREEQVTPYRKVRNEIKDFILSIPESLN